VLQRRNGRAVRFELGVELASAIPGARLVALDGRMAPIYWENGDVGAAAILAFLGSRGANGNMGPQELTARELQVAALIAEGLTNAKIARVLGVAARTVDAHVEHIRNKLGLRSRAQIAVWASERRQAPATIAG
jgi:DNA-binding CsgD family transcriptional regulator